MKCKWIIITGLDGAGKTTLKSNLSNYLKNEHKKVKEYHSPYDQHLKSLLDLSGDGKPMKDSYTDFLIFALDHRLQNYRIKRARKKYDYIISQRGPVDLFVHASLWGYNYKQTYSILQMNELETCEILIHLNAKPEIAYQRIKDDKKADKYEYLEYIKKQYKETKKLFVEIQNKNKYLDGYSKAINIYIDTTNLSTEETFKIVLEELNKNNVFENLK